MKVFHLEQKVEKGVLVERPNRFVGLVSISGHIYRCHLPNPGRMTELFDFGTAQVCVVLDVGNPNRKTDGTIIAVLLGDQVINLDTTLYSELLEYGIQNNVLPLFEAWSVMGKEHTIDNHRFDFVLDIRGKTTITEVKSTTRVVQGEACFPDAVSKRATDHLKKLSEIQSPELDVMLIFLVYRRANSFKPCYRIDPDFGEIFDHLREKIHIHALQIIGSWGGTQTIRYSFEGEIPVK